MAAAPQKSCDRRSNLGVFIWHVEALFHADVTERWKLQEEDADSC